MRSAPFWHVTQSRMVATDILGHTIVHIFQGSSSASRIIYSSTVKQSDKNHSSWTAWPWRWDMQFIPKRR